MPACASPPTTDRDWSVSCARPPFAADRPEALDPQRLTDHLSSRAEWARANPDRADEYGEWFVDTFSAGSRRDCAPSEPAYYRRGCGRWRGRVGCHGGGPVEGSGRPHFPTKIHKARIVELLDMHVDALRSRQPVVARLSAEFREAGDANPSAPVVRCDGEHLPALERFDRGRFPGLQLQS